VKVVQIDHHLVKLPVGKFLEHILVLVLGRPVLALLPLALLLRIVILVHKIIVVAQIVLVNVDIPQRSGDGLFGGGLEVGQEALETLCSTVSDGTKTRPLAVFLRSPSCAW
jgi:hypothetical protein